MYELLLPSIDHLPDQPPVKRPGLGPDVARESLAELIDAGLVWMYWLGRSARDLTADEVRNAVEDLHRWKPMDERGCPMIYLTDSGERVFNGP